MRKLIEFAPSATTTTEPSTTLWATPKRITYQDLRIKPEFEARRLRFKEGQNWLRIVPPIKPTDHGWMMPLHVLNFEGGRCNHPKTHQKYAKSCFDAAYGWMKEHQPEGLYTKANKAGARLLTDPGALFWAIIEENGKPVARLFLGSGYDGSRGGAPGLGYEIQKLTKELDENGKFVADVIDPKVGRMICVEKTQPPGAKFPSYSLRRGGQPKPMEALFAEMNPEEVAALCPLDHVARELSEEEEWQCLGKVIAPETVAMIRSDIKIAA